MKPRIKTTETHYDNGQLCARYTLKDGKLDGLYERWYESGKPWVRCTYKDGKLDGLYERWHENGKPWKRRTYTDGVLVEDLLKQEETKMETSEATGKNESVRITLKGVEIEVEESVLIEALEAKGIKTFKPEPEPKRKPKWAVSGAGEIVGILCLSNDVVEGCFRQGRAFYSWDDAEAFVAMERQMAAVVGTEPEEGDPGWTLRNGYSAVQFPSAWQAEHALGLTAKTRKELEPKVAVFQRFQQIEKVRLEDLE